MQKVFSIICSILILAATASAQKNEQVTVKAGTRVQDYFPIKERYRYPSFIEGKIIFKNGANADAKLNYNFLSGEMEYIHSIDTLAISNSDEIKYIALQEKDTFCFDKCYLELIYSDKIKVAMKQNISLIQILNKDSYGVSGSTSAKESINMLHTAGNSYKLTVNEDRVYQKTSEFFIAAPSGEFVPFNKQKSMQLFPQKKNAIREYLKSDKTDFTSKNDLIRFALFLHNL